MEQSNRNTIWTIGHSTHSIESFVEMLQSFEIEVLADVRSFPGSRKYPHFSKDYLSKYLPDKGIEYMHIKDLGGRRKPLHGSVNTRWRNDSFRAYADYTATKEFKDALNQLEQLALLKPTAYMCSEAVWWRCHRSVISDILKTKGWEVMHIAAKAKASEHPYTSAARVEDGKLFYSDKDLFNQ